MDTRFRTDYAGEFVIVESRRVNGRREETREWIVNPIENQHISGRATCIGSTVDRDEQFNYMRLQRHRGGLLGSKKLQNYGVGEITQEMRLDFAVETNPAKLEQIIASGYQENNVVYTTANNCIRHPGEFYLIPQYPRLVDIALLPYLAAFDGHQEIFLLGYNIDTPVESQHWINQVRAVMDAYPGTVFYCVGQESTMPDTWLDAANSKCINYREFISYCDV